jgi:hypothetical protein
MTRTILKACASVISHPLTHICDHSLFTGIFTDHLTIEIVKPLHKKGDKSRLTSRNSIALLTIFSKVHEKSCVQ